MITGLDSASLKIDRASEHLEAMKKVVGSLASTPNSYELVEDGKGKEKIHFLIQPPPQITILAGEIVYQLRSALDHLAFELVKVNPMDITLPTDWETKCCFPLWLNVHKKRPIYNCFDHVLPGISKTAFAFIEGVQPYRSGPGPHNAMRLIAKLSNIDRHRYLNVTLPKASQYHHLALSEGRQYSYGRGGLKNGAEIEGSPSKADDILEVRRSFATYVTFDEPTVGNGPDSLEVEHVLDVCLDQVKRIILPGFMQLLKKP